MEKTIPCRWFMGCNSQNGFYSLFGQFTRPEEGWRCILIKGGPGTGKSTLMKRVIKLALQRGQPVEEDPLFLRCRQPGWGHSAAAKDGTAGCHPAPRAGAAVPRGGGAAVFPVWVLG